MAVTPTLTPEQNAALKRVSFWISKAQNCDLCHAQISQEEGTKIYDCNWGGLWGLFCQRCFNNSSDIARGCMQLGIGLGQEFTLTHDGRWLCTGGDDDRSLTVAQYEAIVPRPSKEGPYATPAYEQLADVLQGRIDQLGTNWSTWSRFDILLARALEELRNPAPPIPSQFESAEYRGFEVKRHFGGHWSWVHEDYDGPEDSRHGTAKSYYDCIDSINDWHDENGEK